MPTAPNVPSQSPPSAKRTLVRTGIFLLPAWLLLCTSFFWARADSTRPPYFRLDSEIGRAAYWITESGGVWGASIIATVCLIVYVSRPDKTRTKKPESLTLLAVIGVCAGLGAAANEHVIKEYFRSPRPNIRSLTGSHQSAIKFYDLAETKRGERIRTILLDQPIALTPRIKAHWIATTGFSFPSGHSFSAMFFATFFLALAISRITTPRIWIFYLLVPWSLAVCYSRTILRVHTPTDITTGSLQGIALGSIAFLLVHAALNRMETRAPETSGSHNE